MKRSSRVFTAWMLATMLLVSIYSGSALAFVDREPPEPTYIETDDPPTIVDGVYDEWDLPVDFFADMYNSGNPDEIWPGFKLLSKLYLRYNCSTETLYAIVLGEPNVPVLVAGEDAFIKIPDIGLPGDKLVDGDGDGVPGAEFEWVNSNGRTANGWEASAPLAQGSYELNVHTNVWDDGESKTSAVANRGILLVIDCESTAITLASFAAEPGVGSVTLAWETGTEVDNAGFNLYRATTPEGPYTKINDTLIAAKGDPVSGASYSFLDKGASPGTYYYKLEDVDYYGVTTLHGPASVTVMPRFRRPAFRPTAPGF
ncbi:MAG: hypothetical protein SXV54_09190 [Chloroflexota bacterium]|nr:hypothetical protein [Chloroflexota bacterium]